MSVDLLDLLCNETQLRQMCRTNGGEYAGPCPFCGGRDRFRVWPHADRPGWWCRVCRRSGDAAGFLQQRHGIGYRDACRRLGVAPGSRSARPAAPVADASPPSVRWQWRGRMFVGLAHECLQSPAGQEAREYLHRERGLSDATISHWRLGLNPTSGAVDAEEWDVDTDNGRVWLPAGIVIPTELDGTLWAIKLRRIQGTPKYQQVASSRRSLFGSLLLTDGERAETVIITEGEFDAMLVQQQAGDLVGVVTAGSAAGVPSLHWLWEMRHARRILVAYDLDAAGRSGTQALQQLSARIRPVRPIGGNDLTDMHRAGGDLRAWVVYHLRREARQANEQLEHYLAQHTRMVDEINQAVEQRNQAAELSACAAEIVELSTRS